MIIFYAGPVGVKDQRYPKISIYYVRKELNHYPNYTNIIQVGAVYAL